MINNFCPVCEKKELYLFCKVKSQIKDFEILRCSFCGLAFQNPMPSKKKLKGFYEKLYRGEYNLISTEEAFSNYDENQEEKRISKIERFKKGGRLLDVGASSGFFLRKLKEKKNWIGYGLEYSKTAVKYTKGLNIRVGEITSANYPDSFFDVITMHSVLEHIPDINSTMKTIRKKLKKEGIFVFSVPNISSFEFFLYKLLRKPFAGFIYEHLYYFTPKSVSILLTKNGFKTLLMTSRHYATLKLPPRRPLIGWLTFPFKLLLEYTDLGGILRKGNIIYVYAEKNC